MIQAKKFSTLEPSAAQRKLLRLLYLAEQHIRNTGTRPDKHFDPQYWPQILNAAACLPHFSAWSEYLHELAQNPGDLVLTNQLRHKLGTFLGKEHLEWDLFPPVRTDSGNPDYPVTGTLEVYLHNIRSPYNVGSIFRTADGIGCRKILLSPLCPQPGNSRLDRSSMGTSIDLPWDVLAEENLFAYAEQTGLQPVALELGGTNLWDWAAPEKVLFLLGSEELGLPEYILSQVPRISIPMAGKKASLNVGVSFGIAGSWWNRQQSLGKEH